MTDKQIIIDGVDVSGCECYSEHREGYCGWHIPCEGDICLYKLKWALQQLKRKEQECEELKDELRKNFEEKETLHLIIDRLLEASGYDTNTANAEDFEDVYENMRYKQQQLKRKEQECEELKEEQAEIKKYLGISHKTILKRLEELTEFRDRDRDEIYNSKQENKKLKEQLTILDDEAVVVEITVEQFEEYKKLKAENETLFKAIGEVNRINKRLETENEELKDRNNFTEEYIKIIENINNGLEQKLKKIKDITEKHNCDLDNGYVFLNIIKIIEE